METRPDLRIGFTGTRHGLTVPQREALRRYLRALRRNYRSAQGDHGMCEGGDDEFNTMARLEGWRTAGHPPVNGKLVADMVVDEMFEPKPYLMRNRDIVNAGEYLIACPHGLTEQWRGSGTWSTIRYAESRRKMIVFIWPTGRLTQARLRT